MIHPNEPTLAELLEIQKQELTNAQRSVLERQIAKHKRVLKESE